MLSEWHCKEWQWVPDHGNKLQRRVTAWRVTPFCVTPSHHVTRARTKEFFPPKPDSRASRWADKLPAFLAAPRSQNILKTATVSRLTYFLAFVNGWSHWITGLVTARCDDINGFLSLCYVLCSEPVLIALSPAWDDSDAPRASWLQSPGPGALNLRPGPGTRGPDTGVNKHNSVTQKLSHKDHLQLISANSPFHTTVCVTLNKAADVKIV